MIFLNKTKNNTNKQKGFTLIELMVATSLFVVVATVSVMALITVKDANAKAQTKRNVLDNLNFAVENMARNLRVGKNYSCDSDVVILPGRDCNDGTEITFTDYQGDHVTYSLSADANPRIMKKVIGVTNPGRTNAEALPITSPDIQIESLRFIVRGAGATGVPQPFAVIFVEGVAKPGTKLETRFKIQTSASQRVLDF
ncbi:MAG: type II secretion system protein [Candidatus Paceibacterota bacterium]|jgi:prepilin-type N-terminal cleavage/methylation domain-containing protein